LSSSPLKNVRPTETGPCCHSRESGNPRFACRERTARRPWTPDQSLPRTRSGVRGDTFLNGLLDNNLVEAALKKVVLHRKNAYLYKTANGARVGDLFMSLIHTCELNGIDPFAYLTALHQHADALSAHPDAWMPWTYRDALQQQARLVDAH